MINKGFLYNGQSISGQTSRECLSPLPIDNGRPCTLINRFFGIEEYNIISLNNISTSIKATQTHLLLSAIIFLFLIGVTGWIVSQAGFLAGILPGFMLVVGGVGIIIRFYDEFQNAKYNLPLIFNAHKGMVLVSWYNKVKTPQVFASGSILLIFATIGGAITLSLGLIFAVKSPNQLGGWISIIISLWLFSIPSQLWIKYFQEKKKHSNDVYFEEVPWEKVRIEYQEGITLSMVGPGQLRALCFVMYLPESKRIYRNSIGVLSREEALSTFSLIRDYMEHGSKGIEFSQASQFETVRGDYSREAYRETIQKAKEEQVDVEHFLWRLFNIVTLRYWAHWYLEYTIDVLPKQNDKWREVEAWSNSVSESECIPMSEELKEVNQRVRALYANGYRWEDEIVQLVIREYDGITAEKQHLEYIDDAIKEK